MLICLIDFALQKLSSFVRSHLSILDLRAWAIGVLFRIFPLVPMSWSFFPTFSSIRFSVSGFMLRSLIHLDLSFVQGDKYGSIILHTDSQLDQHHFLKIFSFFQYIVLASLSQIKCPKVCCFLCLFLGLQSIPPISMSVSVPIQCSFYHYFSVV